MRNFQLMSEAMTTPTSGRRQRRAGRLLLAAAAAVAGLGALGAGTAAAATLPGSGSAAAPYLIGSDADLDTALQMIDADTAHSGAAAAHYKLTADLDYAQDASNTTNAATANWSGIDWFSGVFDGDGHTIANLNYTTDAFTAALPGGTAAASVDLGFFRVLDGATVKNLTLQKVRAVPAASNSSVGGVAVWSFASTVSGVTLSGSTIGPGTGGGGSFVGGLVALAYANEFADAFSSTTDGRRSTFTSNQVTGGSVSDNNRTGGLVGMATGPTTIADNFVDTTLSNPGHPVAGAGGQSDTYYYVIGGLVGQIGATYTAAGGAQADGVAMTGNVIGGTIKGSALDHRSIPAGVNFASATVGYATTATFAGSGTQPAAGNWSTANNLVSSDIQYTNETGAGLPGADGTLVSPQTLATQATYAGTASGQTDAATSATYDQLGWSFAAGPVRPWTWTGTATAGAPALEASAGLTVAHTTIIEPVGSDPGAAALLAAAGATTTTGSATIDSSGVSWSTAGSYQTTIAASGGYANPVPVTIVVYAPATVIVANPAVSFPQSSTSMGEADVLAALGALLPPGAQGPLTVDLTGARSGDQAVQWNRIGSYTVTVSDTNGSDGLAPATATIAITRAGASSISLDTASPVFQATGSAPDAAAVLRALGAAVLNGDGEPVVDLDGTLDGDQAVHFDQPGVYRVTVSDSVAADAAAPVTATIKVVAVSVVSADAAAYFNISAPPTPASLLRASGATIGDGAGNTVAGTLVATLPDGCGASAGSCTATIVGTDMYGFQTAPFTVAVSVSAATVAVANATATFTATGSAPSPAALVSGLGATVADSASGATPVVDVAAVDWSVPGTYPVSVGDSDAHDAAMPVAATIRVVPAPLVSLPSAVVYLPLSATTPLPPALLLANAGASLTDRYGNAIDGTLSADTAAVDGSVAGTYTATIAGTDAYGFAAPPVTVTVVIYLSAQQPGTVSIAGTPAVGATLTASPAGWVELAAPQYQWLRNGVEIAGATGASYVVTAADAGQSLAVRMTESPEWYSTASAISAALTIPAPVAPGGQQPPPVTPPPATTPTSPTTTRTAAPKVASASYRSGALRLKVRLARKGTLTVKVTMKSGKRTIVLGTRRLSVAKAGTVATTVKLSAAAKTRIKRGAVAATLTLTLKPSAKGARSASAHKVLRIKRGA